MAGGSSSAAGPAGGSGGSGGGNNSGGPSGIGLGSAFYGTPASTSETDGETFDGDAEFEEYDDWDYAEILANTYVEALLLFFTLRLPDLFL